VRFQPGLELLLSTPFRQEVPDAPLRILLPGLQEALLEDSVSRQSRGRQGGVPTLRQQACRAALVPLLRDHFEEERVRYLEAHMHFDKFSFGSLRIDGSIYEHDPSL